MNPDLLRDSLRSLPAALRFLTRLPVPAMPFEAAAHQPPDIERMAPAFPLAGALIGLAGAVVMALAFALGLGELVSATLAVAALAAVTGAFHEDGLADMADGLGGMTAERRLEIMKDSRVGTFGVMALIFATALRIGALQGLLHAGVGTAATALVAASAVCRFGGLWILFAFAPARSGGLSGTAGRPGGEAMAAAGVIALLVAAVAVVPTLGVAALAGALAISALVAHGIGRLALARFGGQTGDVAGAAAQLVEIAFLLALLIFARHL